MIEIRFANIREILSILFDDEIYNRIADDSCPKKEDCNFPIEKFVNFGAFLDGKIIGLLQLEPNNEIHFQVLKEYRKEYADLIFEKMLQLLPRPLFCKIPTLYESVIRFASKHGFKKIRELELQPFIKDGKSYNNIKFILK